MRLLTFIILSSFFFLASPDSEAAGKIDVSSVQTAAIEFPANIIEGELDFADAGSVTFPQINLRTPSKQYRTVSGIHPDYTNLPSLADERERQADRPTKAFSHCVPIGYKLLFPKHYFW